MSSPMSMADFNALIEHIWAEHSPAQCGKYGRCVKYVNPRIDMRDGAVYAVEFRGFGWEKILHTQNECRDLPESLFDRCNSFLDEEKP